MYYYRLHLFEALETDACIFQLNVCFCSDSTKSALPLSTTILSRLPMVFTNAYSLIIKITRAVPKFATLYDYGLKVFKYCMQKLLALFFF